MDRPNENKPFNVLLGEVLESYTEGRADSTDKVRHLVMNKALSLQRVTEIMNFYALRPGHESFNLDDFASKLANALRAGNNNYLADIAECLETIKTMWEGATDFPMWITNLIDLLPRLSGYPDITSIGAAIESALASDGEI